jgi:hypothetical protein
MPSVNSTGAVLITAGAVPATGVVYQAGIAVQSSTGAMYVVGGVPAVIAQSGIPFILAGGTGGVNQFTMGNNGALSTLPTLPTTYSGGAWIYMPANGIFAGSTAGWYWFVASSTTAGTVYNNQYTTGDPKAAVPATPTPFVSTGPGVVSQTTGAFITGPQLTVPGNSMGPNGSLQCAINIRASNSVNSKIVQPAFGSLAQVSNYTLAFAGGSSIGARGSPLYNRNATNRQTGIQNYATGNGEANVNAVVLNGTVDTTVDQLYTIPMQLAALAAAEFLIVEGYCLELRYGA